jgi:hypothetical protein
MVEDLIKRLNRYVESLAPPMSKRYIGEAIDMIEQQAARLTALESERDALLAAAGKEAAGTPIEGSPAFALRGLYKLALEYFIDGKPCTPDEYIAWQAGIIEAISKAKFPDPKYYGGSADEGDQHEVKCAYVDGWNDCRGAILAAPTAATDKGDGQDAEELSLRALYEEACIQANKNAKDAERYRWLRTLDHDFGNVNRMSEMARFYGETLDAAIDATLSQKAGEQQ